MRGTIAGSLEQWDLQRACLGAIRTPPFMQTEPERLSASRKPRAASSDEKEAILSRISVDRREVTVSMPCGRAVAPAMHRLPSCETDSTMRLQAFFAMSSFPISQDAEREMEQASLVVTKENLATEWSAGIYCCASCTNRLYTSDAKFEGPCLWPSFRCASSGSTSLELRRVEGYNQYTCETFEIYCKQCKLFLGHMFEDGKETDTHADARWRHCVLSLSLVFLV